MGIDGYGFIIDQRIMDLAVSDCTISSDTAVIALSRDLGLVSAAFTDRGRRCAGDLVDAGRNTNCRRPAAADAACIIGYLLIALGHYADATVSCNHRARPNMGSGVIFDHVDGYRTGNAHIAADRSTDADGFYSGCGYSAHVQTAYIHRTAQHLGLSLLHDPVYRHAGADCNCSCACRYHGCIEDLAVCIRFYGHTGFSRIGFVFIDIRGFYRSLGLFIDQSRRGSALHSYIAGSAYAYGHIQHFRTVIGADVDSRRILGCDLSIFDLRPGDLAGLIRIAGAAADIRIGHACTHTDLRACRYIAHHRIGIGSVSRFNVHLLRIVYLRIADDGVSLSVCSRQHHCAGNGSAFCSCRQTGAHRIHFIAVGRIGVNIDAVRISHPFINNVVPQIRSCDIAQAAVAQTCSYSALTAGDLAGHVDHCRSIHSPCAHVLSVDLRTADRRRSRIIDILPGNIADAAQLIADGDTAGHTDQQSIRIGLRFHIFSSNSRICDLRCEIVLDIADGHRSTHCRIAVSYGHACGRRDDSTAMAADTVHVQRSIACTVIGHTGIQTVIIRIAFRIDQRTGFGQLLLFAACALGQQLLVHACIFGIGIHRPYPHRAIFHSLDLSAVDISVDLVADAVINARALDIDADAVAGTGFSRAGRHRRRYSGQRSQSMYFHIADICISSSGLAGAFDPGVDGIIQGSNSYRSAQRLALVACSYLHPACYLHIALIAGNVDGFSLIDSIIFHQSIDSAVDQID